MTVLSKADVILRLKRRLPRFAVQLRTGVPFATLGLDSMDTVELLCAVHEEFQVRLTEGEFRPDATLEDLAATIVLKLQS